MHELAGNIHSAAINLAHTYVEKHEARTAIALVGLHVLMNVDAQQLILSNLFSV